MSEGQRESNSVLSGLLRTGDYSDLRIRCGNHDFKVHKAIIYPRCEYFASSCKPGAWKEGAESVITLAATTDTGHEDDVSVDDPEAVKLMIDFIYGHDYEAPVVVVSKTQANGLDEETLVKQKNGSQEGTLSSLTPSGDCNTILHARMYALGSKYGISSLQTVALGKFHEAVRYAWNHEDFITALQIVYTTTPDSDKGLRRVAAHAVLLHRDILLAKAEFEKCVLGISGLACDLIKMKQLPKVTGPSLCSTCNSVSSERCMRCRKHFACCRCNNGYQPRYRGFCCNNCLNRDQVKSGLL